MLQVNKLKRSFEFWGEYGIAWFAWYYAYLLGYVSGLEYTNFEYKLLTGYDRDYAVSELYPEREQCSQEK